jgi:choline dehydrogenase-like flavoprotein
VLVDLNNEKIRKVRYDVCIYGSGPAGITLARTLASRGKSVALIEGGSLEYSEESQSLYDGKSVGNIQDWNAPRTSRLRFFGGTSNHWAGRCGLFDPIDFEHRDYFGLPGWPIKRDDVLSFLPEALAIVDIPAGALPVVHPRLESKLFRLSEKALSPPTRFGEKYLKEIRSSPKIHSYVNANLVNINLRESGDSIASTEVRNFKGGSFVFTAGQHVLAMGAIENARTLLNADKQLKNGIGNHSGMVGRCFMEHLNVAYGRFVTENEQAMGRVMEMNPTSALMKELGVGNGVLAFDTNTEAKTYGRLRVLKKAVRDAICESDSVTAISRKISDFNCPGDGVVSSMIEQSPNPDSRVTLDTDRDQFGLRRIKLNWVMSDADRKTIRVLGIEAAKEMARMKFARLQLNDCILDERLEIEKITGAHAHHMGTTRMSADPRFGVVDANSKVHGISNLYIAGSSVFPTGGGINPTLTIVMLALRLGEHIG